MSGLATSNIFAALQQQKKKSASEKEEKPKSKKKSRAEREAQTAELEKQIFSQPAAAAVSNWADFDDEDEDEGQAADQHAEEEGWEQVCGW